MNFLLLLLLSSFLPSLSCSLPLSPTPPYPFLPLSPITPLLTLDEVQLCQEFEFFGDIQLEVSEGWISSQSEMLKILNCFAEPGAAKRKKQGKFREIKEEQCLHDTSIKMGGRVRQTDEEGGVYDNLSKIRLASFYVFLMPTNPMK